MKPLFYRRWMEKIRYSNSLPEACVMGWRRNIVAAFESQVDANAVFAFESCSGALASARTRLRAAEARAL